MFGEHFINYDLLKCCFWHILCACLAENSPYVSFENINDHTSDINKYSVFNMISALCKSFYVQHTIHHDHFTMYLGAPK